LFERFNAFEITETVFAVVAIKVDNVFIAIVL